MKKITVLMASATLFLFSCGEGPIEVEKTTVLKKITLTAEDSIPNGSIRVKGIGHSGDYAYRTDSLSQYGFGIQENFDDSLINTSIRVCVDFWVKSSSPLKGDGLALSYNLKETIIFWQSFDPFIYGAKPNEWINIKDSVTFHADQFKESGMLVKLFGFNANKKAIVDFDDINITIKNVYTVSE